MNDITLVFCTIQVTIHFSQKGQASVFNGSPDLHTYWQFYSSLNTLSMIFLIQFAPNTTIASIVITIQTNVNAFCCVPTERIYLYALSCAIPYSK